MNNSNFIQTGGYPLNAERLKEQQTAYAIFNSLGALAGNLTIISGCTLTGTIISNGVVFINGEVIDFREATLKEDSTVIIIQEEVKRPFKNGSIKTVNFIRYATFGTAETSWLWTDFKDVDPMVVMMAKIKELEKKTAIFQPGGVAFPWFKPADEIPEGFQEVVDIRGRTIVGYDPTQSEFNEIKKKGGQKNKTLSIAELPKISPINGSILKKGGTLGGINGLTVGDVGTGDYAPGELIKPFGGEQAFSILNPYRIAMYIEYAE